MTVRAYSRQEFRAWLKGLPQDDPFCLPCYCPISTYMRRNGWVGALEWDNGASYSRDTRLTVAIDKHCLVVHPNREEPFGRWSRITPRECIAIIDELQERTA